MITPDPRRTLRAYLATLRDALPGKSALALTLMIAFSLTEGVGLLLMVPLLGLAGLDTQQGGIGRLEHFLAGSFSALGLQPTLLVCLGVYVLAISMQALLGYRQALAAYAVERDLVMYLRRRLFQAVIQADWLFLARQRAADFTHALTIEADRVGEATSYLLLLLVNVLVATVYFLLALQLSPPMTALALLCSGGLAVLLRRRTVSSRVAGESVSQHTQELYAATIEHFGALKTAKSQGAEERDAGRFASLVQEVARATADTVQHLAAVQCQFQIGVVVTLSLILYVAVSYLALPAAALLLLLFLFARLMPRISSVLQYCQHFVNLLPAFASVQALLARCEAAAEVPETTADGAKPPAQPLQSGIRFRRVSFHYRPDEDPPAIDQLDLLIPAGEMTAIVGPSGAGKSTVADLCVGLLQPTTGSVLIDGVTLASVGVQRWRRRIGYVAQDTFLFHDTVRANLLWAAPQASQEEMWHALRSASAATFVAALPQGLETVLGDRGTRLSGGERQRLALARALLRRPVLLILDEATSAIDAENESCILQALRSLHGQLAILLITHRLAAVRDADAIHVLERGRLVESGDWNALLQAAGGRLRSLCLAQGIETP